MNQTLPPSSEDTTSPESAASSLHKVSPPSAKDGLHVQRCLLAGVFAIIPIAVTWLVFDTVFTALADVGGPIITLLADAYAPSVPWLSPLLHHPLFQGVLAALVIFVGLYLLGLITSQVIGQRLVSFTEAMIEKIPFVKIVYGLVKRLVKALQQQPGAHQRVVLIAFPSPEMRTLGLVMRTLRDATSGQELAAVYVPTAPNPSSGYIELVPVESLTPIDWSVDEAMAFIISGGAVGKDTIKIGVPKSK